MEHVLGIDPALHRDEPLPIGPIRPAYGVSALIVAQVVQPTPLDQMLAERRMCRPGLGHVLLCVRWIEPDRRDQQVEALLTVRDRGVGRRHAGHGAMEVLEQDPIHR